MFVVVLIAATVIVTNILVQNAGGIHGHQDNIWFLDNYKKHIDDKGMVTLDPFEEVKNTIIVLHDYDGSANASS